MGKRIDITDKLNFEENPVIVIKGKEIEVNTDASNVLKILSMVDDKTGNVDISQITEMADLLFTKTGKKNLESLKLNMKDFAEVVSAAMELATGGEDEGELSENDGTTSSKTGI